MRRRALVFGASGAVGGDICTTLERDGWEVLRAGRGAEAQVCADPFGEGGTAGLRHLGEPVQAAVWAQGANASDSIKSFDLDRYRNLMQANCDYVLVTLSELLAAGALSQGSRLCIVSSIWQQLARQDKLSYTVAKAAVGGLVRSAAVDLAADGILINAVLPGVLDTPMTRANLDTDQIDGVVAATGFDRLPSLAAVADTVAWLCSDANGGTTGESITVDLGFTHGRPL